MPTDKELYQASLKLAGDTNEKAKTLAARYGLSEDSVRGRLSRAAKGNYSGHLKELATRTHEVDPSIEEQDAILDLHRSYWERIAPRTRYAAFVSDLHFPYARWDAVELMFSILQDAQVDVLTVGNDLLDNTAFGRWDDSRPKNGQRWSNDVKYMRDLEFSYYRQVQEALGATLIQVQGNHDNWWFNHIREKTPENAEAIILDYMQKLDEAHVIQFSKGYTEPEVWLNDSLVFWHGQFAGNNATSNAKNSMKQFTKQGMTPSVVVGHTHRPSTVEGYQVGYNDRVFINSGCMSRIENVPYIKRNPQGWGLGFVYAEYDPTGWHKLTRIDFIERGKQLVAEFKGRDYAVTLDKSAPKEY